MLVLLDFIFHVKLIFHYRMTLKLYLFIPIISTIHETSVGFFFTLELNAHCLVLGTSLLQHI